MNIENFSNPSGKFLKNYDDKVTFYPNDLIDKINYDDELISILSKADNNIGTLSGNGQLLQNPHILISPYIRREAVQSSKIEGTMASLSDLFLYEITHKKPAQYMRLREVRNYVRATEVALAQIKGGKKISLGMIRNIHRVLLRGVRGSERRPGHFRTFQNWISEPGKGIEDAIYVPPPAEKIPLLLSRLENYINKPSDKIPLLIQCALIHYQFETIHPFIDGNGRIGRLLITLYLCEKNILSQPLLYLSAYLEKNKDDYYRKLMKAREESDFEGWLKFFLRGVSEQSIEAIDNVKKLLELQKIYKNRLRKIRGTINTERLIDYLFCNPYITIQHASQYLGVTFPTAQKTINVLIRADILMEYSKKKRNRVYLAKDLIKILN